MAPTNHFTPSYWEFSTMTSLISVFIIFSAAIVSVILCGCCKKGQKEEKKKMEVSTKKEIAKALAAGEYGERYDRVLLSFTINLLRTLSSPTISGALPPSCLISPYALQTTFAVCLLGAHSTTLTELVDTIFPHSGTKTYVEDMLRIMITSTEQCRKRNIFRVFSRVYGHADFRYSKEFQKHVEESLKSKPFIAIDYHTSHGEKMAETTHKWLETSTGGLLHRFTSTAWRPLTEHQSSLTVVSAATLSCPFKFHFYPHMTRAKAPFYVEIGKSIPIDMLRQTNTVGYFEDESAQIIRMEYQEQELALYMILPRIVAGLEAMEKRITAEYLIGICEASKQRERVMEISIPKFKLECEIDGALIVALSNLGLATSFRKGAADFSRMLEDTKNTHGLWISGAVHKAMVEFTDDQDANPYTNIPGDKSARSPSGPSGKSDKSRTGPNGKSNKSRSGPSGKSDKSPSGPSGRSEKSPRPSQQSVKSITVSPTSSKSTTTSTDGGTEKFLADHPFLFMIAAEPKLTPLFFGRFCGK